MQGKKVLNGREAAGAGGEFPHAVMLTQQHLHVVIWETRANKRVPAVSPMCRLRSQSQPSRRAFLASPHSENTSLLSSLHEQKPFSPRKLSGLPGPPNWCSLELVIVDSRSSDSWSFPCTALFPSMCPVFYTS